MFEEYAGDNPGAAMLVLHDGRVVLSECRGLADLESRMSVTSATNFRLASVTKPILAEAIGLLVARNLLRYDDAVFQTATVQQLLTHTSGIADYEELIPDGQTAQVGDADVLRLLEPTRCDAPAPWHYSNSAYVLLGLLVERVAGTSLETFLRDELFAKHGMHGTTLGAPEANRAYGYDRDGTRWVRRDQSVTSATRGDGGIYSSIDDLARWLESRDDRDVPFVDTDVTGVRYGRGWFFDRDTIFHPGDSVSFRNAIVRWPAERLAVIVLTNRNEGDPVALARGIREYYLQR